MILKNKYRALIYLQTLSFIIDLIFIDNNSGNGKVTLRQQIQTNEEINKGLWMFQPIENNIRNSSVSHERILITDVCRGHNYPKQFTTYQIVSSNDDNICLGVQFSPDFMEEQKCLRVLPCYKSKGNLLHTNYQ